MKIFTKKSMISLLLILAVLFNFVPNFVLTATAAQNSIFTDGFESYAVGTTVASGGTAYSTKYNGTGDRNQVVVSTEQKNGTTGNVLQLQGASGWSSQIKYSFTPDDKQYLIVAADIKPVAGKTPARICFCSDSAGGSWVKAVCGITMENGGFVYGRDDKGYPITTDLTYTTGNWYHLSLVLDRTNHIFYIYLDGTLIGGTSFAAGSATPGWLELASPYNTAYFDNINIFSTDTLSIATVKYNSNGGSEVASREVIVGEKAEEPTAPTKSGWIFAGWYKDTDCQDIWDFETDVVTETMTLYAKWDEVHVHNLTLVPAKAATHEADGNIEYYVCSGCGKLFNDANATAEIANEDTVIPKGEHDYGDTYKTDAENHWKECSCGSIIEKAAHIGGEATCVKKAICSVCGAEYGVVNADNHKNTELRNVKSATEEETGYTGDTYCTDCENVIEHGTVIPKLEHTHNMTAVSAKDATCTAEGNIAYWNCTKCGKYYSDAKGITEITLADTVIAKLDHSYNVLQHDNENHWHKCENCDAVTAAEAHNGGNATCISKAICSVCGVEYGNFADHTFAENTDAKYLKTAATCNSKAVYYKSCSVCGVKNNETFEYGDFDSSNHIGGTYIKDQKEATCYEEGYTGDTYCGDCNAKIVSGTVIEKNAHNPASVWSTDENYHWKDCQTVGCGNIIDKTDHTGGEATCTKKALCSVCGAEYGAVTEHKLDKVDAKAATHEADGNIEYYVCSVCGKLFNDANATAEITNEDTVIAKGEHDYGDTYKTDAENHWKECGCGNIIEKAAHAFGDWKVVKEATATEKGTKEKVCSVCGYKTQESIPVIDKTPEKPPQTGDTSNLALWIVLMFISATGVGTLTVYNRKKRVK